MQRGNEQKSAAVAEEARVLLVLCARDRANIYIV